METHSQLLAVWARAQFPEARYALYLRKKPTFDVLDVFKAHYGGVDCRLTVSLTNRLDQAR